MYLPAWWGPLGHNTTDELLECCFWGGNPTHKKIDRRLCAVKGAV